MLSIGIKTLSTWNQKHGVSENIVLLKWKSKLIKLINNINATLKIQNSNNHRTGFSSLKKTFIKNSFQHKDDQFVVSLIYKILFENILYWTANRGYC